jgi:hypothetical protein
MTALHYLQTTLSEIIDHNDPEQTKEVSFKCNILIWYISVYFIHMLGRVRHIQNRLGNIHVSTSFKILFPTFPWSSSCSLSSNFIIPCCLQAHVLILFFPSFLVCSHLFNCFIGLIFFICVLFLLCLVMYTDTPVPLHL